MPLLKSATQTCLVESHFHSGLGHWGRLNQRHMTTILGTDPGKHPSTLRDETLTPLRACQARLPAGSSPPRPASQMQVTGKTMRRPQRKKSMEDTTASYSRPSVLESYSTGKDTRRNTESAVQIVRHRCLAAQGV